MQRQGQNTTRHSAKSLASYDPTRRTSESLAERKGATLRKNTKPYLEMIRETKADKQKVQRNNEIEQLKRKVRKLEEEKQVFIQRQEDLVKGMQELQSQVVEKNKNIEEHQFEMQALHKEIKSMNRENMKEISRLMEENTVLLSRANECEAEHHRRLETMQHDMQQQTEQLRRSSVHKAGLEVETSPQLTQLREHEKQLLDQLRHYQNQVEGLSQQVLSLSEMNRSIAEKHQQKDIMSLAHENKSMAAFMEQQQSHLAQVDSLNKNLLAIKEECIVLKENNVLLKQKLEHSQQECTSLQQNVTALKQNIQNLEEDYQQQCTTKEQQIEDIQNYANQQTLKADSIHNSQQVYLQIQGEKNQQVLTEKESLIEQLNQKVQQAKRQFEHQILTITKQKQSIAALEENKSQLVVLQEKYNQLKEDYLALETRYDFTLAQSENNQQRAKELELQVLSFEKQDKIRSLKKAAKREQKQIIQKEKSMSQLTNEYLQQKKTHDSQHSTYYSIDNSLYQSKKTYGLVGDQGCKSRVEPIVPRSIFSPQKISLSQQLISVSQRGSLGAFSPPQIQMDQDLMVQYKPLMMEFKE